MTEKPYQILLSEDDGIMTIVISGQVTGSTGDDAAQDVARIEEEHKPERLLIDCRKAVGRADFSTTYEQVKKYHVQYKFLPSRVAVLDLEENEGITSFHETAARNAGLNIRFFIRLEDALDWLTD